MAQDRKVTVTLKIESGKDNAEVFKKLKSALSEVGTVTETAAKKGEQLYGSGAGGKIKQFAADVQGKIGKAHQAVADKIGGVLGMGKPGAGAAAGSPGAAAGLGGISGILKVAGPIAAAYATIETAANAARISHDKYTTDAQKGRQLFASLPGGETVQKWVDSFTGRDARMQEVELNRQRNAASRSVGMERQSFSIHSEPMLAGQNQRIKQQSGFGGIMGPSVDRTTAAGELEFRQASRLLPVRRELARAERDAAVSSAERRGSENELNKITGSENRMLQRRAELQAELARNNGSGPERQQILSELEDTNKRIEGIVRGKQEAAAGLYGNRNKEAEANHNVRKQQAALKEAEAANLEEQAATASGGARRIGGMNVMDRGFAVQAVKMVQQYGPDAVPPEILQAAQQAAPETVGKLVENSGAKSDQFKELQKLAPADFGPEGSSPEDLRKKAQGARDEAEGTRATGESEFAKAAGDAGKDMARVNVAAFKTLMDVYKMEIEVAIRIAKGQI